MAKLGYENIFESITDTKTAHALKTATNVLIDLDDVMAALGYDDDSRRKLVLAVRKEHFARYI